MKTKTFKKFHIFLIGLLFFIFILTSNFLYGKLKTMEKELFIVEKEKQGIEKGSEDTWAFEPEYDEFDKSSLLDLRYLNEKYSGQHGFIKRSKDGSDFVRGDGKPIKFWAINTSAYNKPPNGPMADLKRHGRFLAKRGINMVRFHGNITPDGPTLKDINKAERDKLWKLVAAMKKSGIYVTFSPYWAVSANFHPASWGTTDPNMSKPFGLLFFDKKLQEGYKYWMKKVLTVPNPYTGIPLKDDPTLAIIQLQNEDSLLFWTSQRIKGSSGKELRKQFAKFLIKKYGSLDKALNAWNGTTHDEDDFKNNEVGLYIVWEMTQKQKDEGKNKRLADQLEFMTKVMYDFNKMMADYLKNELGCKQLINAGNWKTADNVHLLDCERYSYTANDIIGVNRYYTGIHNGKYRGWAIVNGDRFTDDSVLLRPRFFPINAKQVYGYPYIISESTWVPPLGYQSEGPFLVAAYSSLNGLDIFYWFATKEEDWRQPSSSNGFLPSIGKWPCNTPMLLGMFPAAALIFRKSYIKKSQPVVYEERALEDMWFRKDPLIAEDAGYDPNRDLTSFPKTSPIKTAVNPLAFLVGSVVVKYGGDPKNSKVIDLNKYIDTKNKIVKSITEELEWDYGKGICLLKAPKAQGATGFLGKIGRFNLPSVEIHCKNKYATIFVVSMDDKPLTDSKKILIQVGTVQRPTRWKTKPIVFTPANRPAYKKEKVEGEEIIDYGTAPWQIRKNKVRIYIDNDIVKKAYVLDANGMIKQVIRLRIAKGKKVLNFPKDAMYVVLKNK